MSKRDDIIRIWRESFSDSREYVSMYFDRVYRDDEALTYVDDNGVTVSSLLLQQFRMTFHGAEVPVSYLAGAATRRSHRGKGYMSKLMREALEVSAQRGDMLCSLIPARSALYYYYKRFGFSTVFFTKEQRFTSLHSFPVKNEYHAVEDIADDDMWDAFDRFQHKRESYITHTRRDMDNIRADLDSDSGDFVAMAADDEDSGPRIVSMAWAVRLDDLLLVKDVMGEDDEARTAALRRLRELHPGVPFLLLGRPGDTMGGRLMPRGMARVVNAGLLLETVAQANPKWASRIRVTDPLLPQVNSHTYIIKGGRCEIDDSHSGRLDMDVPIDVLGDVAFSSSEIGDIMCFPSVRPMISLMLD
ncbi:GNAT family N-acetyltransferase [uncultured Duncaniella sp.]|uniref:GNAT family N-acetyltransferase n=1 Tax=uncultured Duncaniella sp. TaxID=2768039 RepID=UPI0025AA14C7|nr:GNAT family N-acetyltransferase [uncultured Duncaniella sp.]